MYREFITIVSARRGDTFLLSTQTSLLVLHDILSQSSMHCMYEALALQPSTLHPIPFLSLRSSLASF